MLAQAYAGNSVLNANGEDSSSYVVCDPRANLVFDCKNVLEEAPCAIFGLEMFCSKFGLCMLVANFSVGMFCSNLCVRVLFANLRLPSFVRKLLAVN